MSRAAAPVAVGSTIAGTLPVAARNLAIFQTDGPAAESTETFRAEALCSDADTNDPATPGRRVALDPVGEQRLSDRDTDGDSLFRRPAPRAGRPSGSGSPQHGTA